MCVENLSETKSIARKEHICNACQWLCRDLSDLEGQLSFSQWREVVKAKKNGYQPSKRNNVIPIFSNMEKKL